MTAWVSLLLILAAATASAAFLGSRTLASKTTTETSLNNNVLFSSRSSIDTLQQQIIQGATLKLIIKNRDDNKCSTSVIQQQQHNNRLETEEVVDDKPNNTYYVREAQRSEIHKITGVLMESFHSRSEQPTFDSYIRRYKQNHLYMCFDAIEESDRGIFVACASSASSDFPCAEEEEEILVGVCLVDGRSPDPSCKIEFLTPSTLASTSPRPYLSDLGVIPSHRRQGIGELLVQACERWADTRGHDKLYLKVEKKNIAGVRLYCGMGYKRTKLPWGRDVNNVENRFDNTLLLEKSLMIASPSSFNKRKTKRTWIKEQLWGPVVAALNGDKNDLPL